MNRIRLGILGGTFNPVHNGHLFIAKFCLEHLHLDKLLFIPSAKPPHKNSEIAEFHHRYNMLKLALSNSNITKFEVSDLENKISHRVTEGTDKNLNSLNSMSLSFCGKPSYSVITLQELHKRYPNAYLFFIIGQDNVEELLTWYHYQDLFKLATIVVVSRKVDKRALQNLDYLDKLNFLEMPLIDISSSDIRDKIKKGENVVNVLPKMVYNYIKTNKLYL